VDRQTQQYLRAILIMVRNIDRDIAELGTAVAETEKHLGKSFRRKIHADALALTREVDELIAKLGQESES
jgi:hypothetical protein